MAKSAADRKQENNLCYVAITRAMKNLYYVGDRVGKA
jgi:superfamily I DNA/RNA helicase